MDAIVGLVNEGQEPINVTKVMGSLNSPFDFNYYIQNFTEQNLNTVIHEDEEYTFRYRFRPIDTLDPVEYHIALTVFYENDEELVSHTFFNDTVTFYEPTSMFDSGGAANDDWVSGINEDNGSKKTTVKRRKKAGNKKKN